MPVTKKNFVSVGNRPIGPGMPVYVIGEIGINHGGELAKAKTLIDVAVDAGVDAVKFQKRTLENIYLSDALEDPNRYEEGIRYLLPILKEVEFGRAHYDELYAYCQQRGIDFLCTPFDEGAVDFLEPYNLPAYKIASADLTNLLLLEKVIATGKPLIISTGMSTLDEIDVVAAFLRKHGADYILLHCVSAYPMPTKDAHLNVMSVLRQRYGVPVGFSSHEIGIEVTLAAVAAGATVIERHITLDKKAEGPDHSASLEPAELRETMRRLRLIEEALGTGKKEISRIVVRNQEALGKSLVALRDIAPGEPITRNVIGAKGPAKGLSPLRLYDLVGKTAKRHIAAESFFLPTDCEEGNEIATFVPAFRSRWGFKGRFTDLENYRQRYSPRFVEIHLNDNDLFYNFEEHHGGQKYPFEIFLHYPTYWQRKVVNIAAEDSDDRKLSIEIVQRVIDMARRVSPYFEGTPKVVVHLGGMSLHEVTDNRHIIDLAYDSMRQLDRDGVIFLPENNPPRPWYFAGQWYDNAFCAAHEMIDFCKEFNCKMCFDVSHAKLYANAVNGDYYDYVRLVAPYTQHLHVCDAYGTSGEGIQIHEGEIDFQKTFDLLAAHGDLAEMYWTPEIWQGHNHDYRGFLSAFKRLTSIPQLNALEPMIVAAEVN